jgi:hypothetical protein
MWTHESMTFEISGVELRPFLVAKVDELRWLAEDETAKETAWQKDREDESERIKEREMQEQTFWQKRHFEWLSLPFWRRWITSEPQQPWTNYSPPTYWTPNFWRHRCKLDHYEKTLSILSDNRTYTMTTGEAVRLGMTTNPAKEDETL